MSFCTLHWQSESLGKQVQTNILLPEGKGRFPTLYLLHGFADDFSAWMRRSRIEMYVADLPLIVVMPDGMNGFYTNNNAGPAYFDYMSKDLIELIDRTFTTRPTREARCIGGLSMGGYGALRLGLGRPDLFCSVTSHSGPLMRGSVRRVPPNPLRKEFLRIFGNSPAGSDHDVIELARRAKRRGSLPKIRLDCGTEDYLIKQNRQCHAALAKLGVDHEYQEFPGAHTWDYWDLHVREAIGFHCGNVKIEKLASKGV